MRIGDKVPTIQIATIEGKLTWLHGEFEILSLSSAVSGPAAYCSVLGSDGTTYPVAYLPVVGGF